MRYKIKTQRCRENYNKYSLVSCECQILQEEQRETADILPNKLGWQNRE